MKLIDFNKGPEYPYEKSLTRGKILGYLVQLDSLLTDDVRLELCGTASVLLRGVDFRATADIDVCNFVSGEISALALKSCGQPRLYDFGVSGVTNLFIDYDERLIPIDAGFNHLSVYCLSVRDWIVSKLASPEFEDVLDASDVTLEDLFWVRDNFSDKYGGVGNMRALQDLNWLITEFKGR